MMEPLQATTYAHQQSAEELYSILRNYAPQFNLKLIWPFSSHVPTIGRISTLDPEGTTGAAARMASTIGGL
jgi:hypothetical protein